MRLLFLLCTVALLYGQPPLAVGTAPYLVGAGRFDITGPAAEVNMMGYAVLEQTTAGIHIRQYSRAFIVADAQNQSNRVVFVNMCIHSGYQSVKSEVVHRLQEEFGSLYTQDNVLLSGTHTHSGPAGYMQYFLYQVTSLGFVQQTFEAIVDGVVQSVRLAHQSLQPGRLYINSGNLMGASINRSPTSYLQNPQEERAKYQFNVDEEMTVLKFVTANGEDIGMIDWFAVHTTSMNSTNNLISGDNKGVASLLMEQAINPQGTLPGQGDFVAAFAQSNEGDVSPNIVGARCLDTGEECDQITSTCNGKPQLCVATGPGGDMFESTKIIGQRQFNLGKTLYENASTSISGPVSCAFTHVNMSSVTVNINGNEVHTCTPALGFSFAAGTTDGPTDIGIFIQGDTTGNPIGELIRDIAFEPTEEQIQCHAPKPILINTADLRVPYEWQAQILPLQLLRIGQLVIVGVPGEFTTMAGRRLRESVKEVLIDHGFPSDTVVVIAGLSNSYSQYVTTFEEYQHQRYEGGSTVYGPHTLAAYIQEFKNIALKLALHDPVPPGPTPPNLLRQQISLLTPVLFDSVPLFKAFGDVHTDAQSSYSVGSTVEVEFWSGHPRNDLRTSDTFLTVENRDNQGNWVVVHNDASLDTRFHWKRINTLLAWSRVTVQWDIDPATPSGTYRIRHFGNYKQIFTGNINPYSGTSRTFTVSSQ